MRDARNHERLTVFRNGKKAAEGPIAEFADEPAITRAMTGAGTDRRP